MYFCRSFLASFVFVLSLSSTLSATVNIPLNSPIYFEVDRLRSLGYLEDMASLTKPYSVSELRESIQAIEDEKIKDEVKDIMYELERYESNGVLDTSFSIFDSNRDSAVRHNESLSLAEKRLNTTLSTRFQYSSENFTFVATPSYRHTLEGSEVVLLDTYGIYSYKSIDITVGRQALWWGVGKHGTLLLSNNAQSIDMVKLSNNKGITFDWLPSIGTLDFDVLLGTLGKQDGIVNRDGTRGAGYPKIFALQMAINPSKYVQLGLYRTAIFGGADRPEGLSTLWDVIFPFKDIENTINEPGDQKGGFFGKISLPNKVQNLAFYGEAGGEDAGGVYPSKWSYILGADLVDLIGTKGLNLNLEYLRMHDSNVWYRHHLYREGYTNKGFIVGHPHGGIGEEFDVEFTYQPSMKATYTLGYQKEYFQDTTADTVNFSARYRLNENSEITIASSLAKIDDLNYYRLKANYTFLKW